MLGCSTSARKRRSASAAAVASLSPALSRPLSTTLRSDTFRSLARYTHPMPPWARHPTTSYWPATSSPGPSFGSNENAAPHLRQNPAARPGWPFRLRPTGSSQPAQKRRLSGTLGSVSTASAGSRAGTAGISTRPAPRRLWPAWRVRVLPERRPEPNEAAVAVLGTRSLPDSLSPDGATEPAGTDAGGAAATDAGVRAGAIPQTSQ